MASNVFQQLTFGASSNYSGEALETEHADTLSLQILATGLTHGDGQITLEHSNDGINFIPGVRFNDAAAYERLDVGASIEMLKVDVVHCRYYRVVWSKGSNAAGTIITTMFGKSNR